MIRRHANSRYKAQPGRGVLSHDGAALAVGINVTRYRGRVKTARRGAASERLQRAALMRLHSRSRIVTVSIFKLVTGNQRLT